ncbi:MAG TPA: PstS family phosphate ABC transporter substrate-binding protein [Candidatus Binatia bacterium]|nr:PstS family phosphate ABC transporter substrate-binding protein [Candidatus Binatia bacterium]
MNIFKIAAAAIAALTLGAASAFAQQAFTIQIDGSSTVFPISEAAAEAFQQQTQGRIRVAVGESGSSAGLRRFCRGEIHIADASRPIRGSEMEACRAAGIGFVEIPVAFDGLTVVVHPSNPLSSITVAQLRQIWSPGSNVNNFRAVGGPDLQMQLFGPGSASGTFEYFTEAVNGTARSSRTDYTPSEDDNVLVQGVTSNPGGMAYFGLAYFEENRSRLKALAIDGGDGPVVPSRQTVENGTYAPLSRPIFIYVNAAALRRPQVQQFVQYYINNAARLSAQVGYIPLPATAYPVYLQRAQRRQQGTAFGGRALIGASIEDVLARPLILEEVQQ